LFGEHTIHLEIFCFEYSGRYFPLPKLFCSPTAMGQSILGVGLGSASTHIFFSHRKTRFKQKYRAIKISLKRRIFGKSYKIVATWERPSSVIALPTAFLGLNAFYYFEKAQKSQHQMFCFCFFRAFEPIFPSNLVGGGRQKSFLLPRDQGTLATPLLIDNFNMLLRVHIRRTDKLYKEASLHEVSEYMKHVDAWYDKYDMKNHADTGEKTRRRIYLATDEPNVVIEAKEK